MKTGRCTAFWFSVLILGVVGQASAEGDPLTGKALARDSCAGCHDVEPGGQMKQDPPSFAAIAAFRSPAYIQENIVSPHGQMPEIVQVFGRNVDDLVTYIVSLEEPCF